MRVAPAVLFWVDGHVDGGPRPLPARSMGGPGGRKVKGGTRKPKPHAPVGNTIHKHRWDDICADELRPERRAVVLAQKTKPDPDLPGMGQHYCVACARYCVSAQALEAHCRTAKHRRRERMLTTETPYSHAEANAAAGRAPPSGGRQHGREAMETG